MICLKRHGNLRIFFPENRGKSPPILNKLPFSMKKHSWILDLPPNSPKYFGNAIKRLCVESFALSGEHNAVSALANHLNINLRSVRRWANGELNNKRGRLTLPHFRSLITIFWEHHALTHVDEITVLARCAGEDFALDTKKGWVWELTGLESPILSTATPTDPRYPNISQRIPHTGFVEKVVDQVAFCLANHQPLVIYGPPGIGKTTFIKILEHQHSIHPKLRHHFPDGLLRANLGGQGASVFLQVWLKKLAGDLNFNIYGQEALTALLQRQLKGKRMLLLIDDVDDASYARLLMQADPQLGLTIITTTNPDVASQLSSNKRTRIDMPEFTLKQTQNFYRILQGDENLSDNKTLETLRKYTKGNPLDLFFTFKLAEALAYDWQATLDLLTPELMDFPDRFMDTVYLAQLRLYEKVLGTELQKRLRSLGALQKFWSYDLKTFAALWGCSLEYARWALSELHQRGGWIQPTNDGLWTIHGKIIKVAHQFLVEYDNELSFSEDWVSREKSLRVSDVEVESSEILIPFPNAVKLFYRARKQAIPDNFRKRILFIDYFKEFFIYSKKYWEVVAANTNVFTSGEYVLAVILKEKEQKMEIRQRFFFISIFLIVLFFLLKLDTKIQIYSFWPIILAAYIGIIVAFFFGLIGFFVDHIQYSVTWRQLIQKGVLRYADNSKSDNN
jgi:hypothetical protein